MVFAAGLGTRLRPITERLPKALVPVAGVPMLERVARRLVEAGATRIVVNVHAFADEIERFVGEKGGFGVEVVLSREPDRPLETGGGLLSARDLFREDGPILLHNVDVLSDLSLEDLLAAHGRSGAIATLAVQDRPSARHLLFDDLGLFGRTDRSNALRLTVRDPRGTVRSVPFCGVHAVSPRLLRRITERGVFSILDVYLRLAAEGERIPPFRADGSSWTDIGRPADLERAETIGRP